MITENIYLNIAHDSELDMLIQALGGNFLGSTVAESKRGFLQALANAVGRSDAIVTIGSMFGQGGLAEIMAKGLGLELESVNWDALGIIHGDTELQLPKGAIPLLTKSSTIGGAVLESGDQCIILLTDDLQAGKEIFQLYVEPYILAKFPSVPAGKDSESVPAPEQKTSVAVADLPTNPDQVTNLSEFDDSEILAELNLDDMDATDEELFEETLKKPKSKKKRVLLSIFISLFALILLTAAGYFGYEFWYLPNMADQTYSQSRSIYGQTGDNQNIPIEILTKYGSLYEQNKDIIGWVKQEKAGINYPVVSAASKPSGYYATHLFDQNPNKYGTPYITGEYDLTTYMPNLVIYGSNYNDGRMFSGLEKYLDLKFYKSAPTITMDTIYYNDTWKIFGVMLVEKDTKKAGFNYKATVFEDDAAYQEYINQVIKRSVINCAVEVKPDDEILSLVTQYSKESQMNVVVVARKVKPEENQSVDTAQASFNGDVQIPEIWKMKYDGKKDESAVKQFLSEVTESTISSGQISSSTNTKAQMSNLVLEKPEGASTNTNSQGNLKPADTSSASSTTSSVYTPPAEIPAIPPVAIKMTLWIRNEHTNKIESGDAVSMVARVIEGEMGSHYELEALKAQAVASYSYLMYQGADKNKTNPPAAPMKDAGARALQAAQAVCGQRVYYNGAPCNTLYFAMSAGKTANGCDLWSGAPYLVSVDSSIEKPADEFQTTVVYKASDVANWVSAQYDIDLNKVKDKSTWFKVTYDCNNLYAKSVVIGGELTVKGNKLRENLFTAARVGSGNVLRSHAYRITYNKSDDKFTFTVKGYGHGVGMSQVGANLYAQNGWNYMEILTHYYTGVTIL